MPPSDLKAGEGEGRRRAIGGLKESRSFALLPFHFTATPATFKTGGLGSKQNPPFVILTVDDKIDVSKTIRVIFS